MKKIFYILATLLSLNAKSQFCNTSATNLGSILPSSTTQTTSVFSTGRNYFTFNATVGCTYDFATCGLSTIDTYLSLYSGTNPNTAILQTSNDDACSLQSDINWTCPTTGVYSILITRWTSGSTCNAINGNVQLSYNALCPYPTTLTVPFSGNNSISCGINTTIYDNGGVSTYSNNSNGYTVLNVSPTASINIQGSYSTETSFDYIYIYSGVGTTGALLATYNGSGSINYTGALGQSLTIKFVSDGSITYNGFQLNVSYLGTCSVLPIELVSFYSENKSCGENIITWKTATETNNNYMELERSFDAINFEPINKIISYGDSYELKSYIYKDNSKANGYIYFRLKQVDLDGSFTYSKISSVYSNCGEKTIIKTTNVLGQEISENFEGCRVIFYSDGSVEKKVN